MFFFYSEIVQRQHSICRAERVIDNAYQELPKEGVFQVAKEVARLVCRHHGMRGGVFLSIAWWRTAAGPPEEVLQ